MSLGFRIYHLLVDFDVALQAFARIVDRLGLSDESVRVEAPGYSPPTLVPPDQLGLVNSLFSGMDAFSIAAISGVPLETTGFNVAPHVTYMRSAGHDQMTIFSPEQADLCDFAKRFLRDIPGKYGFGMDWNRPGSFYGYTAGIEDFESAGGKIGGISDAGRWGELYLQNYSILFDKPLIRDIYPVNLLTTAHLNRDAGDGTVQDLIRGKKAWGKITRLADDWFMWCIQPGVIDAARDAFESRNLLQNNPSGFFRQVLT